MPITFADFQQGVAERIQDSAGKLASTAIDGCIREALAGRYSQARPLLQVADFTGDGHTYEWEINATNFPGWVPNFSSIADVEYPAGDRDPSILDKDEWRIYWVSSDSPRLRLVQIVPASGQVLRVQYTASHAEDGSDVPESDFYGAVNLAAVLAAWRLHALYNQLGDSAVGADAVDYRNKAAEYRLLGQDLEKAFKVAFGLDKDEPQPAASHSTEWRTDSEAGGRKLTH
jgi:hypothetical protein